MKPLNQLQKISCIPREPADRLHNDAITGPHKCQQLLQLRAGQILTAHAINENLLHAKRLHQHLLPDGILFLGADPDIADLHVKSPVSIGRTHMGYRNALPIASVFHF